MAEKPSPLAKAAVGSLILGSGALLIYNLFFRPKTVQVTLNSYPIRTILLIDGKYEVATPKTIKLTQGKHKFTAVPVSPDLMLTYGFKGWSINGITVSRNPTLEINVTKPTRITAMFTVTEAGIYPIIPA